MITSQVNIDNLLKHLNGDSWPRAVRALTKAITLIENNPEYASELLNHITAKASQNSQNYTQVIGLTGYPGAGKSTLINLLVKRFRAQNKKVAVLAVDPSSSLTGGAVLGDRIRLQEHFRDEAVFIRSMSARGELGGLSKATGNAIELIKCLGFDFIIVETVGVGQSESEIIKIADTSLLVLLPNTGDEVQFMKAGLIQLAHIFVVNKSDLSDPYRMMLELEDNEPHKNGWRAKAVCTSAVDQRGIDELILEIEKHKKFYENKKN